MSDGGLATALGFEPGRISSQLWSHRHPTTGDRSSSPSFLEPQGAGTNGNTSTSSTASLTGPGHGMVAPNRSACEQMPPYVDPVSGTAVPHGVSTDAAHYHA